VLNKKPKDKIREVVEQLDINGTQNVEKMKRIIRNNKTISDHAKHLPDKKG
jgi:hypothetical protein